MQVIVFFFGMLFSLKKKKQEMKKEGDSIFSLSFLIFRIVFSRRNFVLFYLFYASNSIICISRFRGFFFFFLRGQWHASVRVCSLPGYPIAGERSMRS